MSLLFPDQVCMLYVIHVDLRKKHDSAYLPPLCVCM